MTSPADTDTSDAASLAGFVRTLGRGPGRARPLDREEAREAMTLILEDRVAPQAVGALLMLMRYRGETAEEIGGFVEAMRTRLRSWAQVGATLDWPSYASGRSRGAPLFLLAARLAARSGARVLLHGWNSHQNPAADVRRHLDAAGIPAVATPEDALAALDSNGIVYVPLETLDPDLMRLLQLRNVLGLRSPVNTALRALNPTRADSSVQGVFHPPYRTLQQDAAALLGERNSLILKGGGGEFERHPGKAVQLFGLRAGEVIDTTTAQIRGDARRLADADPAPDDLARLWSGSRTDPFAEDVVTGTAALAIWGTGMSGTLAEAEQTAAALWAERHRTVPSAVG